MKKPKPCKPKSKAVRKAKDAPPTKSDAIALLPVQEPDSPCKRCGFCCRYVLLTVSPSHLRRDYEAWINSFKTEFGSVYGGRLNEIHLLWPMLIDSCRGKWQNPHDKSWHYVYSCNFLGEERVVQDGEIRVLARCKIRDIRPHMCQGYPYYTRPRDVLMGAKQEHENPGYIKGCGYNSSPKGGFDTASFGLLTPLTDEEK